MTVAWGGVEQWLDRNPEGTASLLQIQPEKYLKNTKKIQNKSEKIQKNAFSETHWS